jgi:hypothetical protein
MAELRHRLESAESVSVEELQQLARQRQTSILETLSQAGVPSEQIGLGEIMEVDLEAESEDDWVSLILEVSAG